MLSTMKSIILIALTTMLTIANTKAYPSPEDNFQSRCGRTVGCDWTEVDRVRSYCSTEKRCQLLMHLCASDCIYSRQHCPNPERRVL